MAAFLGEHNLATFDGLWDVARILFSGEPWPRKKALGRRGPIGNLYCATCGDQRRMFFSELYAGYEECYSRVKDGGIEKAAEVREGCFHAVFQLGCVQCDAIFTAVLYDGPGGNSLCIVPSKYGGATDHSPESVKFYCDQASRAASVGAYTAAIAMLRPAVDVVLEGQGYTTKWLGDKLADLEKDINAGAGAQWTKQ